MGRTYCGRSSGPPVLDNLHTQNAFWIKAWGKKTIENDRKDDKVWRAIKMRWIPTLCMLIISTLAYWVSSSSYWLPNKKRRLWTTPCLFAVLISKSQMGTCGEKHSWWTVNIRGLPVMISHEGVRAEEKLQHSAGVKYCIEESSGSLFDLHSTRSSESRAARARLKYLGS